MKLLLLGSLLLHQVLLDGVALRRHAEEAELRGASSGHALRAHVLAHAVAKPVVAGAILASTAELANTLRLRKLRLEELLRTLH